MKIIKNNILMLKYIFKYCPNHILLVNISSILGTLSSMVGIFFTKYIIDSLTYGINYKTIINTTILIFILNLLISQVSIFINQYVTPINILRLSKGMQKEIFEKCINIDYKCYEDSIFYDDFTMAVQQSDSRALLVLNSFTAFISSLFGIAGFSIIISFYDPFLFVLVLISVTVNFIFMLLNTKVQHIFYEDKILETRKSGYAQRVFYLSNFAKEIRLFKGISEVIKFQFDSAMTSLLAITTKYAKIMCLRATVQTLISNSIHIFSTIYIAFKVIKGIIKISDFITLSSSTSQLEMQINTLLQVFPSLYEHSLYIENFKKFINYKSYGENKIQKGDIVLNKINKISIQNLSFTYPNNNKASLLNINIEILNGNHIAFVGKNGSGKSTLIKLITQLYIPQTGSIKYNDKHVDLYNNDTINDNIAVLFQDYQIFSVTILENVLMRKLENQENDEKIVKNALKSVGLYDKIMQLPKNIYTNIGYEYDNNGVLLSGGELQRLAIARLFAKKSNLIILDEPSSSLDPISENEIFNDILNNTDKKTIILSTHRLGNITNCDMIYFFCDGNIIERGCHNELMMQNGEYAKMYYLQSKKQ